MATIQFIGQRIEGKIKEIEKLEKKIERIHKAEATAWKSNPYYLERDLRYALSDLQAAQKSLDKYRAELAAETEKAARRSDPAILEFLEAWKRRCFDFYAKGLREAHDEKDAIRKQYAAISSIRYGAPEYAEAHEALDQRQKAYTARLRGYYEKRTAERNGRSYTTEVKVRDGELEYINRYFERTYEESTARLSKELKEEANRKYDFIIERTNAIVGEITDAGALRVGDKGDLNGYIVGTKGTAKVQTIGAGGYNIQCFHFRTLITPLK